MKHFPLVCLLLFAAPSINAADIAKGKTLVHTNCMSCHDDSVYTRQDKRVKSLAQLQKQVNRCQLSQGLNWFDQDTADAVAYLNNAYYHFK